MRIFWLLLFTLCTCVATAQGKKTSGGDIGKIEDTLAILSRNMIQALDAGVRFRNDSLFIRTLVRGLKTPYSFYHPFDSIETVSKLYAPDSSFRIFTWQFQKDENYFRQRGAIQMNTADGRLKLFPLIDVSDFTDKPTDSVRTNTNWIGAIYYAIQLDTFKNKKYYTLLGYDDYAVNTTRKWIEVLTFNEMGEPIFGGNYFKYAGDANKPKQPAARFLLEYKKEGRARMHIDAELKAIVFDHLTSETNEPQKRYTLIPDGDYEAFTWKAGAWVHNPKLFSQKIDMRGKDPLLGNAPMDAVLRDKDGKINEEQLMQQSLKNMEKAKKEAAEKEKKQPTKKPAAPVTRQRETDPQQREY